MRGWTEVCLTACGTEADLLFVADVFGAMGALSDRAPLSQRLAGCASACAGVEVEAVSMAIITKTTIKNLISDFIFFLQPITGH
jgi:sulfite reductase beta subunit-like hemoprotein